jgi:hypothetical protein
MALHQTVRDALPVRLGDRKYNIDVTRLARATIDPIRQGFDTQGTPGEQSLNQAGVWKRSRDDWELGAGQREADTPESGLRRFFESTGINPWVKNELTLLPTTAREHVSTASNLYMETASTGGSDYIYVCDGSDVAYSTDNGENWSTLTTPATSTILGIASDGTNVYIASTSEVQKIAGITVGSGTGNVWTMSGMTSGDGVWVANGYLIASDGPRLTVLPSTTDEAISNDIVSATFSQVDTWSSVIGTPSGIYAAGVQGNRSRIYFIGINDSTTDLLAPVIAAELPVGETVNVLAEYGGLITIGTSKGFRLAQITGGGFLTYGPRINISGGTEVLEPQGEFIWFGWTNYDSSFDATTRSGLGRIGLAELTDVMVPAYASDLMAEGVTGTVQGVVTTSSGIRLFSVSGDGVWQEQTTYLGTGTINEGRFRWGTTELKSVVSVDLRHSALLASESVAISLTSDDGSTATVTSDTDGNYTPGIQSVSSVSGEYIAPQVTLAGPGTSTPTLHRWTTRAIPMPFVAEVIQLPVVLTTQTRYENRDVYHDTYDDYAYIRSLLENRSLVTFEMGSESKTVYVAGVSYEQGAISKWSDSHNWFEGVLTVSVVTVQS